MARRVPQLTAVALGGLAGLHLVWATGSSFPFATTSELADSVVGRDAVPSATACVAVAGALGSAAALVGGALPLPLALRKVGVAGVVVVLATRGSLGLFGRTDLVSPGSTSATFRRLDRRLLSPLCLSLAAGAATALR